MHNKYAESDQIRTMTIIRVLAYLCQNIISFHLRNSTVMYILLLSLFEENWDTIQRDRYLTKALSNQSKE